jgi:hypothetical protein
MKKIGDAAFEMADGEEIRIPMSPVRNNEFLSGIFAALRVIALRDFLS